ncbi:MAG TPA: nuclear transport factor 2 family protein [Longimicrobiales bacterium]|nr:nuclear transport factor 2 family protein [Longimicrobiales bacterium]
MCSASATAGLGLLVLLAAPVAGQTLEELRSVVEEHYAAIHAGDLATVGEQHLPEMSWFPHDGRLLYESGSVESAQRMGAQLDYGTANVYINHFNAQVYGDVAVLTFYLVGPRTVAGVTEDIATRVTAVWVREGDDWKEAHHHESRLAGSMN